LARCIDQAATCGKVEVFFVTGRREIEYKQEMPSVWTLRNLEATGFFGVARDHLYMRDKDSTGPVSGHKIAARMDIESKGFTIIANVGDQKSDLAGDHAELTFKVPNPFYFIP
jgi:predicted secreted acid phosphatase